MLTSRVYRAMLRPLSKDEGGGWLATIPDLPGCMSDGETPDEALDNVEEAAWEWLHEEEGGQPLRV